MTPVETGDTNVEPAWDSFGIQWTDFRPNWDGDLVNLFSTVEPQSTAMATASFMCDCARQCAAWILAHRSDFGEGDKFGIIIGWPVSVRETGRQVIKTGGTYEVLEDIVNRVMPIEPRAGWSTDVFETLDREQGADTNPLP